MRGSGLGSTRRRAIRRTRDKPTISRQLKTGRLAICTHADSIDFRMLMLRDAARAVVTEAKVPNGDEDNTELLSTDLSKVHDLTGVVFCLTYVDCSAWLFRNQDQILAPPDWAIESLQHRNQLRRSVVLR